MTSEGQQIKQQQRVEASRRYSLLGPGHEPAFDRLTRIAARSLAAALSFVAIAGERELHVKSSHGGISKFQAPSTFSLDDTLCRFVIERETTQRIPDTHASRDIRDAAVTEGDLRSYVGVPLRLSSGVTVGAISVGDTRVREWSDDDVATLEDLAALTISEIELRQTSYELRHQSEQRDLERRRKELPLESIGEGVFAVDTNGICRFINQAGASLLGYEPEQLIGQRMHDMVHHSYPDGRPMTRDECSVAAGMLAGEALNGSPHVFWRQDGTSILVELSSSPVTDNGDVTGSVHRFRVVSEHQRQQRQLHEGELRKSAMFEAALECIITIDHEGRILEFNTAAERTFGYTRDEALGSLMADLIMPRNRHGAHNEAFMEQLRTGESSLLNERVARPAVRKDGSTIQVEMAITRIDLPGQEHPTFAAYVRDITRRMQAEESHRFYKHVVESVGQAVITTDLEGRIEFWNRSAEQMYGWTADEVVGKLITVITPSDNSRDQDQNIMTSLQAGESWSGEFNVIHRDGTTFPAFVTNAPIHNDAGELVGVIRISTDLREVKQAEREVRFFKHIVDGVGQAVIANDSDENRTITYWNRAAEQLLGWSADEALGRGFYDMVPAPEFWDEVRRIGKRAWSGQPWQGEFLLRHKDGTTIPAIATVAPIFDDTGELLGVTSAYTDASEIKETEHEIRFFKHIVDGVGESVVAADMERRITYANRAAERALGWSLDDVRGKDIRDIVPAEGYRDKSSQIGTEVRESGERWTGEFVLRRTDGTTFPALVSLAPILGDDDELVGTIGIYADISELKQTEEQLRFHKHVVDAVGQAVIANDLDRGITYWNEAAEEMLGWTAEEVLGKDSNDIAPAREILHFVPALGQHVREGRSWSGEFLLQHKDGRTIPTLSTIKPIFDGSGDLIGVLGAHTDIREIKQTEQDLRFHKHIVDAVGQAVVVSDVEGVITYWNRAAEEIYGWSADEANGQYVFQLLSADHAQERAAEVTAMVARGETWSGESAVRRKDGTEFPGYFTVSPIRNAEDEIVGIIGVSHDISDRKDYERQIEFHKVLLDAVGQSVVATDLERNISYWSEGAELALGWTADEVMGRPIADFAPAAHLKDEAGDLHRRVREGETWSGEFPIRRKDGTTFPAVVNLAPIQIGEHETVGVIGVYTDVSKLKETERQIRLHKDMLDAVGQAVLATDENLRVTYLNRAAEVMYGYSVGEAVGSNFIELLLAGSPDFADASDAIEIMSKPASWTGEITTYHRDGMAISVLITATPFVNDAGEHAGLIAAMADITERKATEEALRESNHQITEILETMGDGFISLDRAWHITYVNRRAEQILARNRDELIGHDFWAEFPESEDEPFYRKFLEAFETQQSVSITEFDVYLNIWLEVQAFPSGDTLSVFFRDVTERRENEIAIREAEERYRTLVEHLPATTYIASAEDVSEVLYVSPQVESMFGFAVDEWVHESSSAWIDRLHPDDRDYVIRQDEITNQSREHFTIEYRQRTSDGGYRWVRDSATLIRDADGEPKYWQGLSYDITAEKVAERSLQESEQRFRSLFDNHPDAVFSIDSGGRVLTANPAFVALTGCDPIAMDELRFVDLVLPADRDRVHQRFNQSHSGDSQEFDAAISNRRGGRTELRITSIPIIVDQEIVGVHVVAQDVTIHQELENQLAHQAFHDSLTGLPNRNLFQNRLASRLAQARENGDQFAVLFFDLDDFKVINDSLGHSAGDQLLIEAAQRVQTCIRANDILARQGGDEFTLLLERISNEREAEIIAERIAKVLDNSFHIDGHDVFVTTSIGIAIGSDGEQEPDDLLRNADMAMYEAKNSGKNRFALFEPSMNSRAWLRLTLETEIRGALNRNEFEIYYQPIVDLNSGELDGVEALLRWNHPQRGILMPGEFIPIAEQSGLIRPLGRWVISTACAQLRGWQRLSPHQRPIRLSLNLSSRQYQNPGLIEELSRALENVGFDPQLLTIEITENVAIDNSPNTTNTLQRLKDLGVHLALDDFGSGFSALSYLRRFPIDIVKIDRSFVDGLGSDPEDSSIVEAILAASLAMHLRVTAEGIETREQLEILRRLGCHLGQGYLFSHPLRSDEIRPIILRQAYPWQSRITEMLDDDRPELGSPEGD